MTMQSGSIDVDLAASRAWELCAAIERLPEYIGAIESCEALGDGRERWVGAAFGLRRTWTSEWVERTPGGRIAWRTDDPMVPDGEVHVTPLASKRSRVTITMHYEPQTLLDRVLVNPAATKLRLRLDLHRFKRWAEAQG